MENKISKELAIEEFNKWADQLGIDYDVDSMNDEDKAEFEKIQRPVIRAIQSGDCVINNTSLEYTIKECDGVDFLSGKQIVIEKPKGKICMGLDGYKDTQNARRLNGAMGVMTGLDSGIFPKLDMKDYSFFRSVVTLFLSI